MTNSATRLYQDAKNIWLDSWLTHFANPNDGFHERLNADLKPLPLPRRLLTQCRMLKVFSLGYLDNPDRKDFQNKLHETFTLIRSDYFQSGTGGYIFSLDNKNIALNEYDLYAHAFAILGFIHYYEATNNKEALDAAKETLNFITKNFAMPNGLGYAEALDKDLNIIPRIRRQNPHMHLLEACLKAYTITQDTAYTTLCDQLIDLFFNYFFDQETQTLGEFFNDDLSPHKEEGHKVEAGHHSEWIWLLDDYNRLIGTKKFDIKNAKEPLFSFVKNNGVNKNNGGIFNVQSRNGDILETDKRIWAIFETLRASHIMQDHDLKERCIHIIKKAYIQDNTGFWNEVIDQDLNPITDFYPGTTPYHIYGILRECAHDTK